MSWDGANVMLCFDLKRGQFKKCKNVLVTYTAHLTDCTRNTIMVGLTDSDTPYILPKENSIKWP